MGAVGLSAYFLTPNEKVAVPVQTLTVGQEQFLVPTAHIVREVKANYQYYGPGYYDPATYYGNYPRGINTYCPGLQVRFSFSSY